MATQWPSFWRTGTCCIAFACCCCVSFRAIFCCQQVAEPICHAANRASKHWFGISLLMDMPGWKARDLESGPASLPGSGSSTSSGHCLGKIPTGSIPTQGQPTTPATPQSPHSAFNIPVATLMHPPTTEWGCIRPEHLNLQLQPSAHCDQRSARAAPLSFSTRQQCGPVPGQPFPTPQHFPNSLKQPDFTAQQQRELPFAAPHQSLNAPQQSPISPHVASGQLQHMLLREAPAISRHRVECTSSALSGTHHHVNGSYELRSSRMA